MREEEGKRRVSKSEAVAVISLIVFIIVFQLFTFLINRFAPLEEDKDAGPYVYPPYRDSVVASNDNVTTVADSCMGSQQKPANRQQNSSGSKISGSKIIKIRRNNTPYGHRQYGYKKAEVINLNTADSAAFTTLYGIGPYFAKKIVEYRERLGGSFVSEFQLLEIKGIDSARFESIRKRIMVDGNVRKFSIANSSFLFLKNNPYIGYRAAKGIIAFREEHGADICLLSNLLNAGILSLEQVALLKAYVVEE